MKNEPFVLPKGRNYTEEFKSSFGDLNSNFAKQAVEQTGQRKSAAGHDMIAVVEKDKVDDKKAIHHAFMVEVLAAEHEAHPEKKLFIRADGKKTAPQVGDLVVLNPAAMLGRQNRVILT